MDWKRSLLVLGGLLLTALATLFYFDRFGIGSYLTSGTIVQLESAGDQWQSSFTKDTASQIVPYIRDSLLPKSLTERGGGGGGVGGGGEVGYGIISSQDGQLEEMLKMNRSDESKFMNRLDWLAKSDVHQLPLNSSKVMETQLSRLCRIDKVCQLLPAERRSYAGHVGLYSYGNNIVVIMPKTGSTNLLYEICAIDGQECMKKAKSANPHYFMLGKVVKGVEPQDLEKAEKFKFVTVRLPWKRLLSTYFDKFIYTKEYMSHCQVKKYHLEFDMKLKQTNKLWSFRDFIDRCVIGQYRTNGVNSMNEHWRPQHICGSFCFARYNFIAKLETFKTDELIILHKLGSKDIAQLRKTAYNLRKPMEKSNSTMTLYNSSWRTVSNESIAVLREIYRYDFIMFDYPDHPFSVI